jgi:hypothetical protein
MALIIRIDVDRPYGRIPLARHILSRMSSDFYFPKISAFGYLNELATILTWLNEAATPSYVFFRRCTLPSARIIHLLEAGQHQIGLHLENSRSFTTFLNEKQIVENHVGRNISAVTKHGSGAAKFGFHHYSPYEPDKYIEWATRASMRLFLGNLEDPMLQPVYLENTLIAFPSAFWLEPSWRDTNRFPVEWLLEHGRQRDIVLLVHPENVLADSRLIADFNTLITRLQSRILL